MNKMKRSLQVVFLCILLIFAVCTTTCTAGQKTVVFGDLSWDSIQFHNRVLAYLLEEGWGYKSEYTFSETMPGYLGLERGDLNIIMEVWTEAQKEWWEKATSSGKVINCGRVFPNAASGWYMPRYVIEGDKDRGIEAAAPDLKGVEDIKKYWKIFKNPENPKKGRFYNAPTGWSAHTINIDKIKAYGLKDIMEPFDPGSATALATAIKSAYEKGEPVIAYYWEPTPLLGQLDMVMVQEPPHDPETWEKDHGCASPSYTVAKAVNAEWLSKNEKIRGLLERYHMTLEQTNQALAWMKDHDNSAEKAAIWFLKGNMEQWKEWVQDQEQIAKITSALAKE
jgi:glycine betaine/proline transport system substrate-binding protein